MTCPPRSPGLGVSEPPWEAYYAVVFAVCVGIVEAGQLSTPGRILASSALAAMVPWYLLAGRRALSWEESNQADGRGDLRGQVYLGGLIALFALVQSQNADAWFLSFGLSPLCFHVTAARRAMVYVTVFNMVAAVFVITEHPGIENTMTAVGLMVFAIGFSYVYSVFVMRVIEQALENRALIEQLSAARSELDAAHHEAGVLAERHRLAGDIHDTLAQGFTSIVTLVQAAQAGLDPAAAQVRRHLDMALSTARDNLAEARALVTALSPAGLEPGGLGDALRRVAEATAAQAGITVRAEVSGEPRPLPTGTEVVLLRVGQEALANVRKHAGVCEVSVRLRYAGALVELTVSDDGAGFEMAAVNGGYGLRGMRDRVRQAGGTVDVTAAPGAGTRVRVEVPA